MNVNCPGLETNFRNQHKLFKTETENKINDVTEINGIPLYKIETKTEISYYRS